MVAVRLFNPAQTVALLVLVDNNRHQFGPRELIRLRIVDRSANVQQPLFADCRLAFQQRRRTATAAAQQTRTFGRIVDERIVGGQQIDERHDRVGDIAAGRNGDFSSGAALVQCAVAAA